MRTLLCLSLCLSLVGFLKAEENSPEAQAAENAKTSLVHVGDQAPVFAATDLSGKAWDMASFKGKLVLVNFFATWCPPCIEELPHLEKEIWSDFAKAGLVVVAVGRGHKAQELQSFTKKLKLTFTILPDADKAIYGKYATKYIPRTYLIGKDGKVLQVLVGYEEKEFQALIAKIKAELK